MTTSVTLTCETEALVEPDRGFVPGEYVQLQLSNAGEARPLVGAERLVPRVDEHPPSVTPPAVLAVTPPQQPETERQGQQA